MTTTDIAAVPRLPSAVIAGSYLLAGMAAVEVTTAIAGFYAIPEFRYAQSRLAHNDEAGTVAVAGMVTYLVLAAVFGGLCLLLAMLTKRGSGAARVLSWVLSGLTVCFVTTLVLTGVYDSVSWYGDLTRLSALALVLLAAGAVTSLALPPSHVYFRATQAARQPRPPHPGPPSGYRPPDQSAPPPGYQPPPMNL
ncbi:hypothetical protein [Amycolatopsis sp. cmx-8-4]|uniref:hypothetical protein n=1 Tax=Amycolatopsis sp. cmx-8-4 TaxID=2790947 RepID=UPI00397A42D7